MSSEAEQRLLEAIVDLSPADIRDLINDATMKITPAGAISSRSRPSGRDVIRSSGQFSRANLLLGINTAKKPRKKNKKGAIRKGKTQADIMRRAQKLLRKMS
jgi:ribosomal protein L19E